METAGQYRISANERIYQRNIPSAPLQPYMNVRPLNSKYTKLPIVEPRVLKHSVPLAQYPTYSPVAVFNPGDATAPFSGYAAAVNVESELKGQIYALQKCSQATYVPRSNSDLYENAYVTQSSWIPAGADRHDLLFKTEQFDNFNPNTYGAVVGIQPWGNATRAQMHNLSYTNADCGVGGGSNAKGIR
jgi:hypothetical protein